MKRVGNTAARKARGTDTRKRPTFKQQVEALDLLKSTSGTAIAARLNVDSDDDKARRNFEAFHIYDLCIYVIEASRGFLQLSVPMTLIRPKGVAKQKMKWAMRIIG